MSGPDTFAIRAACRSDAAQVAAIYAFHVRDGTASFDTSPPTEDETATKIEQCIERGWPFLVAARDSDVLGYAYATQFRDRPAYALTCENSIYIGREYMGRGIGRKLLDALIQSATECGFRQMIAVIGGAEPRSVALHRKTGFVEVGRMRAVGRKFGRWLDTLYMQLSLGPGDRQPPEDER